jgi:hypothetical protein
MIETCDNWTIGSHFRVVSTFDLAFLEGAWVDGEKEHRLEVYACYIVFRAVERSVRTIPELSAEQPQ